MSDVDLVVHEHHAKNVTAFDLDFRDEVPALRANRVAQRKLQRADASLGQTRGPVLETQNVAFRLVNYSKVGKMGEVVKGIPGQVDQVVELLCEHFGPEHRPDQPQIQ